MDMVYDRRSLPARRQRRYFLQEPDSLMVVTFRGPLGLHAE